MLMIAPQRWLPLWRALLVSGAALLALGVSSCGSGESRADSQQTAKAAAQYKAYLEENGEELAHWAETIVAKVEENSVPKAGSRYAASRVPFGRIRPAAELFEPVNARIDSTEAEAPPDGAGFNQLERAIFLKQDIAGMRPTAEQALRDVESLQAQISSSKLTPDQIVEGANQLLAKIVAQQLPGQGRAQRPQRPRRHRRRDRRPRSRPGRREA